MPLPKVIYELAQQVEPATDHPWFVVSFQEHPTLGVVQRIAFNEGYTTRREAEALRIRLEGECQTKQ